MAGPDEQREAESLLTGALRSVTRAVARRPRTTLVIVLLTVVASVLTTVRFIGFKTNRADLIDPEAAFHQRWLEYTSSFGESSDIVVVVESDDPLAVPPTLDAIADRLRAEPELFGRVLHAIDTSGLRRKGLQLLTPEALEAGLERLERYGPVLEGRWDLLELDSLLSRFDDQLDRTHSSASRTAAVLSRADRLSRSLDTYLHDPRRFQSPWSRVLPVSAEAMQLGEEQVYLLGDDKRIGFLKVVPNGEGDDFEGATRAIDRLREISDEIVAERGDVTVGLTGIPVLENDEMRRSQTDMAIASVISFIGVGLLMLLGFRGLRHPLLAMLMLGVGMAWAFGYTTAVVGHLNILSVSFAAILIGLGIDFAIHYLARYLELRHEGRDLEGSLVETSSGVGTGIVTASVTTALAFFCATFTQFLGVAELGIIAGGGILLCAAATFLVLPALVSLSDGAVEPRRLPTPFNASLLRMLTGRHPFLVMAFSMAAVFGIGAYAFEVEEGQVVSRVGYDANLLNLQAEGIESVAVQERVFEKAGASVLYAVSIAESPEEARNLRAKYERLPSVARVEELASRLPSAGEEQTRLLLQAYRARLSRLPRGLPQSRAIDPARVGIAAEKLHRRVSRIDSATAKQVASRLDSFLDDFERLPFDSQMRFLSEYQARCKMALLAQFRGIAAATDPEPVTLDDLPEELVSRFVADDGKWLVQVYPKEEVWAGEPLKRFVEEVRSVDPEATGTPLQNYEASRQIRRSYENAAILSLAVVALVLLIDFLGTEHKLLVLLPSLAVVGFVAMTMQTRRADPNPVVMMTAFACLACSIAAVVDYRNLRDAILAMFPAVGGGALMFGIFGLLGVDLNPANLIVLPLVLGIGVDDGVHVVHDFRMQHGNGYRTSGSTSNAVVLTSLTSMIGFGSMMVASHRGLYSVGLTLVIGVGSCLFVALVTLPALLTLIAGGTGQEEAEKAGETATSDPSEAAPSTSSKQQAKRRQRQAA